MEVDVSHEKNLGLWGSILSLVGAFVPYIGSLLAFVGFILILVALKGVGDKVNDNRPFKYYLWAFLIALGGIILLIVLIFGTLTIYGTTSHESFGGGLYDISPGGEMSIIHEETHSDVPLALVVVIIALALAIVIAAVYFEIKTWRAMYDITGTKEFNDAATWFKWGAITSIILVGLLLLLVAKIFIILGFSNMPSKLRVGGNESLELTQTSPIEEW